MPTKKIAILGGGITAFTAARELAQKGFHVDVYEASDHIGGLASTFKDDQGFTYDNGPRFMFSTLAEKLGIADICKPVKYFEHLYVGKKYYLFPFGFAKNPLFALSVGVSMLTRQLRRKPLNLGQFLRTYYGNYFSSRVLAPLIEKWCGVSVDKMSIDFASRLLPTNISYIIYSLIKKLRGGITEDYYKQDRYIVYPQGSNAKIFEALSKHPNIHIHLHSRVEKLEHDGARITSAIVNGKPVEADAYLSAIPISSLATCVDHEVSDRVWSKLSYRGIIVLFIKLNTPKVLDGLWTWFPEAHYPFYRVSEYKNALPELAPEDKTLISVELALDEESALWKQSKEEVFEFVKKDLIEIYGLTEEDVLGLDINKCPHAYPVLKMDTEDEQRNLNHTTPFSNLFLAGRTGMFQYKMMEGSFDSGVEAAGLIEEFLQKGQIQENQTQAPDRDDFGRPIVMHD